MKFWRGPFTQSRKCMKLKFTGEFFAMTMKNDAKCEEELTSQFKIDIRNLTKFGWALDYLKSLHFNGLLLNKVYNVWAKKSIGELCLMALNIDTTFEGKLTCAFKNDMRNYSKFSPEHVWKSKNWHGILLFKVENVWA